ncbi:hypothetical protein BX070DRAFT_220838 [Coemansia spiralis]|nr:hypothetical protein BX070DRAFT_220838 [Coemansia spiralis]
MMVLPTKIYVIYSLAYWLVIFFTFSFLTIVFHGFSFYSILSKNTFSCFSYAVD